MDQLGINTIRTLSMDAVQQDNRDDLHRSAPLKEAAKEILGRA
jgi:hypothetical protein